MKQRSGQRKGRQSALRSIHKEAERRLLKGDATIPPRASIVKTGHPRASYVVRELVNFAQIIANNGGPAFGAITFAFSDLPNSSAWTTVFDRYRFKSVKVTFEQVGLQMNTTPATYSVPQFITVIDFDDDATPTSFAQLQRYSTAAMHSSNVDLIRHFLPRAVRPVYISSVSTGYQESDPNAWLDSANANIPHYALKYGVGAGTPTLETCIYNVTAEYVIELAGQRG